MCLSFGDWNFCVTSSSSSNTTIGVALRRFDGLSILGLQLRWDSTIPVAVLRLQSIFGKVLLSKQDQHEVQGTSCWESEGIAAGADSRIALCSPGLRATGLNQDSAMTVQRNAAGGLGVSPILLIFPREWGLGG